MKPERFTALARAIVEGAPGELGRDAIVKHVAAQLIRLHTDALVEGENGAREQLLREQLSIARGFEQDARARVQIIERELGELVARKGRVTT